MSVQNHACADSPIGVFDSGLGGLTVVRELEKQVPQEKIVYFGDIARLPYGIKSDEQIREFSVQNTEFLIRCQVKAIVIACNSSSGAAFQLLTQLFDLPIINVIGPAAQEAAVKTRNHRVGIIGTQATVEGGAYRRALQEINPDIRIYSQACPLLVPLVEEGVLHGDLTQMVLKRYLQPILKQGIDTLVLGCTHYPLLRPAIQKAVGAKVSLVDSAPATVRELKRVLLMNNLLRSVKKSGKLNVYVSDLSRNFTQIGERFLGKSLGKVNVVKLKNEIKVNGKWV